MTVDKRTTRSQNFKSFLLHQDKQQPSLSSRCDELPQPIFDFSMGDPAFYNIYESLKAAYLYSHATGSPISSTLLNIMNQVDRLAVNTTLLLMDQLKHQLPKFPSISKQTHLPDSISSVAPSTASPIILDANSVRTSCAVDDIHITSLLSQVEEIATFQELHLSSVDEQCRSILAACENDNLQLHIRFQQSQLDLQRLERANSALTAELSSLRAEASPAPSTVVPTDELASPACDDSPPPSSPPPTPEPPTYLTFSRDLFWSEWDHNGTRLRLWKMTLAEWRDNMAREHAILFEGVPRAPTDPFLL